MSGDNVVPFTPGRRRDEITIGGPAAADRVSLTVYGDDLEPDEVSRLLGTGPTESHRRGDRIKARPPAPVGMWSLALQPEKPVEPDDLIGQLLDLLPTRPRVWTELHARYRVRVFLMVSLPGWNAGFALRASTLRRLARRGLCLDFDLYADGNEPEQLLRILDDCD